MERTVVPDIFSGSEIMPAVTLRISMPEGAAAPAEAATPLASPQGVPQAAPLVGAQAAPQGASAPAE